MEAAQRGRWEGIPEEGEFLVLVGCGDGLLAEGVIKLPGNLLDAYGIPKRRREQIAGRISANVQSLGAGRSILP